MALINIMGVARIFAAAEGVTPIGVISFSCLSAKEGSGKL